MIDKSRITSRFLRYAAIDTQSDFRDTNTFPSTSKQLHLLRLLLDELTQMGVEDASIDKYGYVMATIPSNSNRQVPAIGFLAHVDTSPDAPGENVAPRIIEGYNGGTIILNAEKGIALDPKESPELIRYIGQTLIVTDGSTLLGADDKAGVAAIMSVVEYLMVNPGFEHGPIRIGFTPDEEVGHGVDHFDVHRFGAQYAYTLDGGALGELEYENFNAASAQVTIKGRNIHPGYAKGKMHNAMIIAMELIGMLPSNERPERTEGYEGFFHPHRMEGSVEQATLHLLIRDHSHEQFEAKKQLVLSSAERINREYGEGTCMVELKDQYYNMRSMVEPVYHVVDRAIRAMELVGVTPRVKPIRGGTDGARLSYMGLPCPNLFAGGENFHSVREYLPVESMVKAAEVMLRIIELHAKEC